MDIFTNNQIAIDGKQTGFSVYQKDSKTCVYHYLTGREIQLPLTRYALSVQGGRDLFERHFIDAIHNIYRGVA